MLNHQPKISSINGADLQQLLGNGVVEPSSSQTGHHVNSKRNEIKEIRNYKQLDKVDLDFDSPRLKQALHNLGVSKDECIKK